MSSLDSLPTLKPAPEVTADDAGKQLEAFFVRQMLAEMRKTVGEGMFSGGYSGEMFQDMLDEAMADEMSSSGGLGIADMISRELGAPNSGPTTGLEMPRDPASTLPETSATSSDRLGLAGIRASRRPSQAAMQAYNANRTTKHNLRMMPVDARVSSDFGRRIHPVTGAKSFHEGIDLAAVKGTKVGVSGPGVVVRSGRGGSYGNLVVVDHGGGLETRYAHLDSISVKVGQQLAAGERVGTVGATGRVTGAHLHFEVRRGGKAIDPNTLLGREKQLPTIAQDHEQPDDR